jgi:four helix bundle protein
MRNAAGRAFALIPEELRIAESGLRKEQKQSARVADASLSVEDFRRRTFQFGVRVVRLVEALSKNEVGRVIGNQLLRSGTAVGANYRAAARARSRAEFIAKMGIVEEECDESLYWLEMLKEVGLMNANRLEKLRDEGNEILSMVVASIRTARGNAKGSVHYR